MSAQPLEPDAPTQPATPPPRPPRYGRAIAGAAVGVLAVVALAWGLTARSDRDPTQDRPAPTAASSFDVVYTVDALGADGNPFPVPSTTDPADWARADLTWEAPGGTAQSNGELLPAEEVAQHVGDSFRPYVSAQLTTDEPADVTGIRCTITAAGQVLATNQSTGPYAVASCHL